VTTFGIDLGTTNSCIAYIDDTGRPTVARNSAGSETTPSVVYFESKDQVVVGESARNIARLHPELVSELIKREMGVAGTRYPFHGEIHTPETISALILKDLAQSASSEVGKPAQDVVITVPAYFGVAEREATRKAGRIAGLNVLNVVPEPVAAALHYQAMGTGEERTIFVYDLGGGTFDTTVIRLTRDEISVVCTDGDHRLGGAEWDRVLVRYLNDEFIAQHPGSDPDGDEQLQQDLYLAAEKIKKELSNLRTRTYVMRHDGLVAQITIDRDVFEQQTAHLLKATFDITARTLELARSRGVDTDNFDDVLLVGGSTRMPAVVEGLQAQFGFEPRLHDPDLAVAKGAALFSIIELVRIHLPGAQADGDQAQLDSAAEKAAEQIGTSPEAIMAIAAKRVATVVPRAFGVKVLVEPGVDGGAEGAGAEKFEIVHLLTANQELPAAAESNFVTAYQRQTSVQIEVWEQAGSVASSDLEFNSRIGEGLISDLPPLPKGSPLTVTFNMDETGGLRVHAVELSTRKNVDIELVIGLGETEVEEARQAVARYTVSQ
jgi:molecular chaperone DnaK (HSP70)